MIKRDFKHFLEVIIQVEPEKVKLIEEYMTRSHNVRENADSIEYPDGSVFYSADYLRKRTKEAYLEGQICIVNGPVVHKAEIIEPKRPTENDVKQKAIKMAEKMFPNDLNRQYDYRCGGFDVCMEFIWNNWCVEP